MSGFSVERDDMGCEKCKNYVGEEKNKQGIFTLCNIFGRFNDGGQRRCFNNDIVVRADVIQSRSRKAAEEIAKRIWDGKEDGGVDTCVLAKGGECREGVVSCREHVVDAFTDLIARSFAEGESCE